MKTRQIRPDRKTHRKEQADLRGREWLQTPLEQQLEYLAARPGNSTAQMGRIKHRVLVRDLFIEFGVDFDANSESKSYGVLHLDIPSDQKSRAAQLVKFAKTDVIAGNGGNLRVTLEDKWLVQHLSQMGVEKSSTTGTSGKSRKQKKPPTKV